MSQQMSNNQIRIIGLPVLVAIVFGIVMSYVNLAQAGYWWWWLLLITILPIMFTPIISGALTGDWWVTYVYAVFLVPWIATSLNSYVSAYLGKTHADKIIRACNEMIELNPNDAQAYASRGLTYTKLEQYDLAISDCSKAIELDPNCVEAYSYRGLAYARLKQFECVISDCSKAIELKSNSPNTYLIRGGAYAELKQHEQAKKDFIMSLSLATEQGDTEVIDMASEFINDLAKQA